MKTKKLLTVLFVLWFMSILAWCGKTEPVDTTTTDIETVTDEATTDVVEDIQTQDDTVKKATKDQCMELTVLAMKVALDMTSWEKSAEDRITKAANLEEEYRKQNIEFEIECEKYMVDPDYMQEVQKKLQEL